MAQHYIGIMVDAIKEFDNSQHTTEFYTALTWIGLKNTVAWNDLTPTEQQTINNLISNAIQDETHDCN